ncbi:hypothetical protein PI86_02540 [Burkholderia sp. A9]|nr:hypothetical protein PI86_02540 [Burkholderia sp. A9]
MRAPVGRRHGRTGRRMAHRPSGAGSPALSRPASAKRRRVRHWPAPACLARRSPAPHAPFRIRTRRLTR